MSVSFLCKQGLVFAPCHLGDVAVGFARGVAIASAIASAIRLLMLLSVLLWSSLSPSCLYHCRYCRIIAAVAVDGLLTSCCNCHSAVIGAAVCILQRLVLFAGFEARNRPVMVRLIYSSAHFGGALFGAFRKSCALVKRCSGWCGVGRRVGSQSNPFFVGCKVVLWGGGALTRVFHAG